LPYRVSGLVQDNFSDPIGQLAENRRQMCKIKLADAMNVEGDFVAQDRSDPNERNGGIAVSRSARLRNQNRDANVTR
jgi:hypothetical protein